VWGCAWGCAPKRRGAINQFRPGRDCSNNVSNILFTLFNGSSAGLARVIAPRRLGAQPHQVIREQRQFNIMLVYVMEYCDIFTNK